MTDGLHGPRPAEQPGSDVADHDAGPAVTGAHAERGGRPGEPYAGPDGARPGAPHPGPDGARPGAPHPGPDGAQPGAPYPGAVPHPGAPYNGPSVPDPRYPVPPDAQTPVGAAPSRGPFGLRPDPPAPRTGWAIRSFLIAEALFLGVSVLVGALVGIPESGVAGVLVAIVVPTVAAALAALLLTWWKGNGPKVDLGMRFTWDDVAVGLVTGLAGLVLTVPAALVYAWIVGPEGMTSAIADVFGGLRTSWPVALLVMAAVVIVAPLCEEILYRGLLWRAVAKHVSNRWVVFLVTTLVFAFAHFELTRTPLLFVVALPLGLARMLTGRLTASVIAHQINNFLPGLALALMLTGVVPAPA